MADPTNVTTVIAAHTVELFVAPATLPGLQDAGVRLLRPRTESTLRAA